MYLDFLAQDCSCCSLNWAGSLGTERRHSGTRCLLSPLFIRDNIAYMHPVVATLFVHTTVVPHWNTLASLSKSLSYLWKSICGFSVFFHWPVCLSVHQYHTGFIGVTSIVSLEIMIWERTNNCRSFLICTHGISLY